MPKTNRINESSTLRSLLPGAGIALIVIVALIFTGMLFVQRSQSLMETQLKDKLRSTAAAAAMQFRGEEIETIRSGNTMQRSTALRDTVLKLAMLKQSITNVRFAYIMRHTKDPKFLEFVADGDLALTDAELDTNGDGQVDENEEASHPGDLYDWSEFPMLESEAFLHPTTDEHIAQDQWGGTLSGYAPIRTQEGIVVGILGIDMAASDYIRLSQSLFSPVAFLLIALAAVCIGGSSVLLLWKRRADALERLEIERSGLLRLAFHQLGGPLTIISWSLQELEESGLDSIRRIVANIEEGVKRLTNILKTLKEADLVHAGKIELKPEFASLTSILKDVSKDLGVRLAARKQTLQLDLTENVTMRLDPKLIAGVATELLTNAIDFSPVGGTITIRSKLEGRHAVFEVEDKGCGIPKKDLGGIFDEFRRGSNATKFKADGNGLGLYIVKGIVERSGGTILIRSREGEGTTVRVRLPIA
jgi:signal transduction histidine kinase